MHYVQPKIIASPVTGSPIRPRIKETTRAGKIYKEAYWYCPDTGQFVQKGLVSITDPTDAEKKD